MRVSFFVPLATLALLQPLAAGNFLLAPPYTGMRQVGRYAALIPADSQLLPGGGYLDVTFKIGSYSGTLQCGGKRHSIRGKQAHDSVLWIENVPTGSVDNGQVDLTFAFGTHVTGLVTSSSSIKRSVTCTTWNDPEYVPPSPYSYYDGGSYGSSISIGGGYLNPKFEIQREKYGPVQSIADGGSVELSNPRTGIFFSYPSLSRASLNDYVCTLTERSSSLANYRLIYPDTPAINIKAGGPIAVHLLTNGASEIEQNVSGQQNVWSKKYDPATDYAGRYHLLFHGPDGDDSSTPHGYGYAILNIDISGVVKWQGKLADGTSFTFNTILGTNGEIPLWIDSWGRNGEREAISGLCVINRTTKKITGNLKWWSTGGPINDTRTYAQGFGVTEGTYDEEKALDVSVTGSAYVPPLKGLNGFDSTPNAADLLLHLEGAGIEEATAHPDVPLQLSTSNKVTLGAHDFTAMKLSVNPSTGIFTGSFAIPTPGPTKPNRTLRREAKFEGIIVPGETPAAAGFFLLPASADKTSAIYSGRATLQPATVE